MLIGEKVCLGPVVNGDGPQLFSWFDDPALVRFSGPYRPTDEAKFNQWLATAGSDPSRVLFAVRKTPDLRLLGHVHLHNIHPIFRSAELGMVVGAAADRGQGYGGEALALALEYCWRELNLQRVSLAVLSNNPDALRLYARSGFEVEGVLRRASFADGAFRDVIAMAALRPD